jgi:hypothetical protein
MGIVFAVWCICLPIVLMLVRLYVSSMPEAARAPTPPPIPRYWVVALLWTLTAALSLIVSAIALTLNGARTYSL